MSKYKLTAPELKAKVADWRCGPMRYGNWPGLPPLHGNFTPTLTACQFPED